MSNRADIETLYPLSPFQEGLLFHSVHAPNSRAYFGQQTYQFEGPLNPTKLQQAWQRVINRHGVLRTAFVWDGVKRMSQVVFRHAQPKWSYSDWREVPESNLAQHLAELLEEDRRLGIDVSQAPLLRLHLIRFAADAYYFIVSQHHLVMDGWSYALVIKEVMAHYQSLQTGGSLDLAPAPSYRNYVEWLASQESWRAEEFWRSRLKGFKHPTALPFKRSVASSGLHQEERWEMSRLETECLNAFARDNRVTPNTIFQSAWALLLGRFAESDVVFGAPTSVRPPTLPGSQILVGPMMNTLPVRAQFGDNCTIRDLLGRMQDYQLEALNHAFPSLLQIQSWSEVESGKTLFDSIVVVENYPVNVFEDMYGTDWAGDGSLRIRPLSGFARTHYPLTLHVLGKSQITFEFVYDCEEFDTTAIHLLVKQFQNLLQGMLGDPQRYISDLPVMTVEDRASLLAYSAGEDRQCPTTFHLNEIISLRARQKPNAVAIERGEQVLTYSELDRRTNQLARFLLQMGVGPEVRVALYLERDGQAVVAILAVLKAGAAFVPIDVGIPTDRVACIMLDSHCAVVLTHSCLVDALPASSAVVVCIDEASEEIESQSAESVLVPVGGENLAYVLFTSGSTGRPKGVAITHRGLANYLEWAAGTYGGKDGDPAPVHSPFGFDLTITSLFVPLATGGRLILLGEPRELTALADRAYSGETNSFIKLTPSHLRALNELRANQPADATGLRALIVGGEQLLFEDLKSWPRTDRARIFNEYGPTETVVGCIVYEVSHKEFAFGPVPVGRPIANMQAYVVTPLGALAPVGVSGDLYIGGAGLARGYLNDPVATAENFVPNSFSRVPGTRLYRTGDQARWLPGWQLEYVGRSDRQIKIRGYRVELGEIEAVLSSHVEVGSCGVIARGGQSSSWLNLVAYVVPRSEQLTTAGLRSWAQRKLPEYMVPAAFVMLSELPLTVNGKLDHQALPAPDAEDLHTSADCSAPVTEAEKLLAIIWEELLNRKNIGRNEDFFRLGGHSLLATQLISRVHAVFQKLVPLRFVFESPTIARLAEQIAKFQPESQEANQDLQPNLLSSEVPSAPLNLDDLSDEEIEEHLAKLRDSEG